MKRLAQSDDIKIEKLWSKFKLFLSTDLKLFVTKKKQRSFYAFINWNGNVVFSIFDLSKWKQWQKKHYDFVLLIVTIFILTTWLHLSTS